MTSDGVLHPFHLRNRRHLRINELPMQGSSEEAEFGGREERLGEGHPGDFAGAHGFAGAGGWAAASVRGGCGGLGRGWIAGDVADLEPEEFSGAGQLAGGGGAAEGEAVGAVDAFARGEAGVGEEASCEGTGDAEDVLIVHEVERLGGDVGGVAVGDDKAGFGEVEQFHGFGDESADDREVDAAFAGEGGVAEGIGAAAERGIADGGDGRGAGRFGVEDAADGEHGVADGLGFQTAWSGAPEERVVGIEVGGLRGGGGGELVGAAEDDLAEEFLEGPAGRLEAEGEVVEEFRVGGLLAEGTEVVGGADQAATEEVEPGAVDGDPGGEGIPGSGEPIGELEAAGFAGGDRGRWGRVEDLDEAAGDDGSLLGDLSTDEEGALHGPAFADAHGPWGAFGRHGREGCLGFGARAVVGGGTSSGLSGGLAGGPGAIGFRGCGGGSGRRFRKLAEGEEARGLAIALVGHGSVERLGTAEDAGEGVVIALADGIELVVVAAGAGDGHAEDGAAGDIDLFVDKVHEELLASTFVEALGSDGEESGGDDVLVALFGGRGGKQVTGDLATDELVVGKVGVDGVDDPVAVTPGLGEGVVAFLAGAFGVAGDVQPVASPAFAEAWGGEEVVDDAGEGSGGRIGGILLDEVGFGREAGEIEADAAEEGARIGVTDRGDPAGFEGGEDEAVDVRAGPVSLADGGDGRGLGRLEGPERTAGGDVGGSADGSGRGEAGQEEPDGEAME